MFSRYLQFNLVSIPHRTGGFGLIELMVSISIMVLIMGVVLVRHDNFNGVVLLRGEAYEIALQLREIQQSAVSTTGRTNNTAGIADEFRTVLGVHFDVDEPNRYNIFQDTGNNYYESDEQLGQQGSIDPRFYIDEIRVDGSSENNVSIVYQRPNFDARFFTGPGTEVSASQVEIDLRRQGTSEPGPDFVRTIEVTAAGQIAVQ